MKEPYTSKVTRAMHDEGILIPLNVSPEMGLINELAGDVQRFLQTNEGFDFMVKGKENEIYIHKDKLSEY